MLLEFAKKETKRNKDKIPTDTCIYGLDWLIQTHTHFHVYM